MSGEKLLRNVHKSMHACIDACIAYPYFTKWGASYVSFVRLAHKNNPCPSVVQKAGK